MAGSMLTRLMRPRFTEAVLRAWELPCTWLDERHTPDDLAKAYALARRQRRAGAALLPE